MLSSFSDPAVATYRGSLDSWLSDNIPDEWRTDRHELTEDKLVAIRRAWDRALFESGYAGLTWPSQFGGRGLGPVEEYLFYEASARHHAPEGFGRVGRLLTGPTLISHGTDKQQARYLPGILSGEEVWCQGFSEPNAGSDLAAVGTRATHDGQVWRISGQKIWTSFAQYAGWCLLLARTGVPKSRHRNLTMFIVDMHSPGVSLRPIKQISGISEFNEVFFDDVTVADDDVIGCVNEGWRVAMTVLTNERGAIEGANKYVDLLEDVEMLSHCLGQAHPVSLARDAPIEHYRALVEALRWQIMRAIEARTKQDPRWEGRMAVLKVYWSELWQDITSAGVISSCPSHEANWRFRYLSSRAATIYSGTSEIQRNIIAKRVLGLPIVG